MLLKRGQMVVNAFKSGIFSIASEKSEEESGDLFLSTQGRGIKLLPT